MLPALVDKFQAIAVGIPDLRRVVAWVIMKLRAWWMNFCRASRQGFGMGLVNPLFRFGNETYVHGIG